MVVLLRVHTQAGVAPREEKQNKTEQNKLFCTSCVNSPSYSSCLSSALVLRRSSPSLLDSHEFLFASTALLARLPVRLPVRLPACLPACLWRALNGTTALSLLAWLLFECGIHRQVIHLFCPPNSFLFLFCPSLSLPFLCVCVSHPLPLLFSLLSSSFLFLLLLLVRLFLLLLLLSPPLSSASPSSPSFLPCVFQHDEDDDNNNNDDDARFLLAVSSVSKPRGRRGREREKKKRTVEQRAPAKQRIGDAK